MSDQENNEAPEATTEAARPEQQDSIDWKAEARKWEARAKSNRTEADQLKELQAKYDDASKQLNESLEKLSSYEAKEQRAAMVSEVSEATGLPVEAVEPLGGTTVEDLTAQAERLKPFIGSNRVVIPNAGDAPDKKTSPESDFVGNLFGQGT